MRPPHNFAGIRERGGRELACILHLPLQRERLAVGSWLELHINT